MKHFLRCFDAVCKLNIYWNRWITAKCWIDIINERYKMPPDLNFNADNLTSLELLVEIRSLTLSI